MQRASKGQIIFAAILVFVFIGFNLLGEWQLSNMPVVTRADGVDSVYLHKRNLTYSRMTMTIEDIGSFPSVLELTANPQKFQAWAYTPPIIEGPGYRRTPKISEVPLPYTFFKRKNCDTVVVRKDSFFLYFRFIEFKDI
jgi:hypothetical protein